MGEIYREKGQRGQKSKISLTLRGEIGITQEGRWDRREELRKGSLGLRERA